MSGRNLVLAALAWLLAAIGIAGVAHAGPDVQPRAVLVLLRMPPDHFKPGASYADSYGDGGQRAARRRIAGRIARQYGLTIETGWPMPLVGVDCFVMRVPANQSPTVTAEALARDRDVAWAEPMQTYTAQAQITPAATPNDPLYRLQPAAQSWKLAELHKVATGRNVRVAVVDSAIDLRHPDLMGQVQTHQDFAPEHPGVAELHGTGVAGVIAAVGDNQLGIVGVAPGARLMALRACWQRTDTATVCDTLSLAKALHYAIDHDAQVINLSLSGPPGPLLGRLIDAALARGEVVVGAVDPREAGGGFPASHPGVVAVTSIGGAPGPYSAPGRDIPTTEPGGRWFLVNGSSYAAAHVSGLYALLREKSPGERRPPLVTAAASGEIDACATLMGSSRRCGRMSAARSADTARQ